MSDNVNKTAWKQNMAGSLLDSYNAEARSGVLTHKWALETRIQQHCWSVATDKVCGALQRLIIIICCLMEAAGVMNLMGTVDVNEWQWF